MKGIRHCLTALALAVSLPLQAATDVIALNFRMAADILPVAQTVVGEQGRVTAYGNQLVVNAPEAVIAELRQVVGQLDRAPKRLLISIDTSDASFDDSRGFAVDGSASAGNVEIQSGRGEAHDRDQVRIIRRSTASRGGGVQQVQTTEGYPALIQVGRSVPLTSGGLDAYGQYGQRTEYRDVMRGFYATATVTGDQVQVQLSSQRDRVASGHPTVIDLQSTETRVSGPLGEWISVGQISESASASRDGLLRRHSTQSGQDMGLRLKVDVLD